MTKWEKAQRLEREWWGECLNTLEEETKQVQYTKLLDISYDQQGKKILDIGGGPVSLLLKCRNVEGTVIDPLQIPAWVKNRYNQAGIEYIQMKAEDMTETGYDEVWIYNVLAHTENPELIIQKAKRAAPLIRIFEWVDIGTDEMHIHTLTADMLDKCLNCKGKVGKIYDSDPDPGRAYHAVVKSRDEVYIHWTLTSQELTYPYYLSIMSALKTQDANTFVLWAFSEPTGTYWPLIKDKVKLMIVNRPDMPGLTNDDLWLYRATINNHIEWKILYEIGGIHLDLDTLCLKDITYHLRNSDKDMVLPEEVEPGASSYPFFNASIVLAKRGSELMKQVYENSQKVLEQPKIQRGDTSKQLNLAARQNLDKVDTIPYGMIGGGGTDRPVDKLASETEQIWGHAEVLHAFANDSPFFNQLTEQDVKESDILYCRMIREVLSEPEWMPFLSKPQSIILQSGRSRPTYEKRFHLLTLPHIEADGVRARACAFTQKARKMAIMLKKLGHTVFAYGVEGSDIECDEFIQVSTQAVLKEAYGDYDTRKETYKHNVRDVAYKTFNKNAIPAIRERMIETDFLLIPFSPAGYRPIIDAFYTPYIDKPDKIYLIVEMGIGYRFTQLPFRVYESYSQYHYDYGLANMMDGHPYHVVIPNYFDVSEFEYCEDKEDYLLYLGRIITRKGIYIAIQTAEAVGMKLVVAGQFGEKISIESPSVDYVGFADVEKRKLLMKNARAFMLPTTYVEPFGGTVIEAGLCGTPVITSDHGAFTETVIHGLTGYRCHTMDHYVWAAKNIGNIRPVDCRRYTETNYSMDRIMWMYEEYFDMILDIKMNVDGEAFKRIHPDRTDLNWLNRWHFMEG